MVDVGGVPAVSTGGGEGFGGGGIWAILLVALFMCGGNGFGGRGCGGNEMREGIDNAELNARFNSLEGQINNVNDLAQLRDNYKESCATNMNVTQQGSNVLAAVAEAKFDNALIAKDAQLSAQACCCETNRNIDAVRFENEKNTCQVLGAISSEGQATRSLLERMQYEAVKDELQRERLAASQCQQNAYLVNALRPFPNPAFQVNAPYTPVNSACNCGVSSYGYC